MLTTQYRISHFSQSGHNIYARDGKNGTVLWSFQTGDDVCSSPAIDDLDDDGTPDVVVGSRDNRVYALTAAPSPTTTDSTSETTTETTEPEGIDPVLLVAGGGAAAGIIIVIVILYAKK
ncbi:MAG: PQQ-binding-like beta-propeller repeat protein [Candidatus Lokiarchaeota archaeon]|nr:PQQ-binding-like beta-propeller repeat protein [Candidatus Lokiarchaeota archaeon]